MKAIPYSDYRTIAKTGDILLWSGKGHISEGIKLITGSEKSHISRVIADKHTDMILNWESTTLSSLEDLDTGRNIKGVQVVELSQRLAIYEGRVWVRQIQPELTPAQLAILYRIRREFKGVPYEKSLFELFRAAYDGPLGENKPDLSSVFCSEKEAHTDMKMGVFRSISSANEFTPEDYAENKLVDQIIEVGNGINSYGPEIQLEAMDQPLRRIT